MIRFPAKKDVLDEKRGAKRLKVEDDISVTIFSDGGIYQQKGSIHNRIKNISVTGAKIQANFCLPVDSLLTMDIIFKDLCHKITAFGKVKWIKKIIADEAYEAGVEFISSHREVIQKLADYISWKLNPHSINPI